LAHGAVVVSMVFLNLSMAQECTRTAWSNREAILATLFTPCDGILHDLNNCNMTNYNNSVVSFSFPSDFRVLIWHRLPSHTTPWYVFATSDCSSPRVFLSNAFQYNSRTQSYSQSWW
jgi:hypothetical protein